MRRNRLGNQYLKNRSEFNKNVNKKQWNYCLSFLRKTKKHIQFGVEIFWLTWCTFQTKLEK